MLAAGDRVLVGVSGGQDSMALLHLLRRLAPAYHVHLGVAHLNHCLRGEAADRDAKMVRHVSASWDLPLHAKRAQVDRLRIKLDLSPEEAARRVRYAYFNKVMVSAGYNKLALGHHMEDNAEQVLLALLRGTGRRGLSGIPPLREQRFIRPLIEARRSQIETYVKHESIPWAHDRSNDDTRFVRNRVRSDLLPLLASTFNPRIVESLNRLADVMRAEEAWIGDIVATEYSRLVQHRKTGSVAFAVRQLRQHPPALTRRLIRMALTELVGSVRAIGLPHIQSIQRLVDRAGGHKEIHLPGGVLARRIDGHVVLSAGPRGRDRPAATPPGVPSARPRIVTAPFPKTVEIAASGIGLHFAPCTRDQLPPWDNLESYRAYLDADCLELPLTVRPAAPGDRFAPLGAGGRQKLKKYFVDHRISRTDRSRAQVIADDRGIIWLVGHRIDERVKVTARTSRILSIEFFLLDTR